MIYSIDPKAEYEICKQRKHQKSGKTASDGNEKWEICQFCSTWFRFETVMREQNAPA